MAANFLNLKKINSTNMKIAKPTEKDFDRFRAFMNSAEMALEKRAYSLTSPEDNWITDLDEDDPEFQMIARIKVLISRNEEIPIDKIDNRIVMYEYLKKMFSKTSPCWRRVYYLSAGIMPFLDPSEDHCAFHPSIEEIHVAPEQ